MRLTVELYDTLIGTLEGDARTFDFIPSTQGLEQFGANSPVLSVSIPLSHTLRRDHAARRRNWFTELLPEGDQLGYMLSQSGLRHDDTPSFLARYGRDVAGALQLWDLDDPTEPKTPSLRQLDHAAIRRLLEDPIGSPLANQQLHGKSSLGGVQPKIVLVKHGDNWSQALGGYPSTHILKPQLHSTLKTTIFDEEYGARIARCLGLTNFTTTIEYFDGLATLVIERYDRADGQRIHQEDFNQVLGAHGNEKYQEYGGIVSLARVARALERYTLDSSLSRLARMVIMSVAIGNLDMHTKNIALLHPIQGDVTLAPTYDMVPQTHMNNDGKLALSINHVYRHRDITIKDLKAEFVTWGLQKVTPLINETLAQLAEIVDHEEPLDGSYPGLRHDMSIFIRNLQQGNPTGTTT